MTVQKKQHSSKILFLVLSVLIMVGLLANILSTNQETISDVKFSEFKKEVEAPASAEDQVVEATFQENHLIGVRKDKSKIRTYVPNDESTRRYLETKGVTLNYQEPESENLLKSIAINVLPMVILLVFIFLIMRSVQTGGGKALSFGKSRAKLVSDKPKITFKDIAGIEEAKEELLEVVEFLREPKKFTLLGGRIPKGVLLIGSPGTGKTILAKGVAGESGVPFFSISGSDFVEMFVGVGASRVRDLFDQAKKSAPCIVFIDEIDAVGRHRGAGMGGGHDEREQTLNQLLVEMDGFEPNDGVIVIAATNRVDVLDPALLRPGRFDRRVYVPAPDVKGRREILLVHSRRTPLAADVDLAILAQSTPGFTGADLENLINEASLLAARSNSKEVSMEHCEKAKDKVLMGSERKSMIMTEADKRITAYHEAGHALVGLLTDSGDPVHKVSIIPRGQALGVTVTLPSEDRLNLSQAYAKGFIRYAMGGRVAEELEFQSLTSGASDDINRATDIARRMVCNWGMSEKIGPIAVGRKEGEEVFMGRGARAGDIFSERLAEEVDGEIHRLVKEGYEAAKTLLRENHTLLKSLAEALLIKETLDAGEMRRIVQGEDIVSEDEKAEYQRRLERSKNWRNDIPDLEKKVAVEEPAAPAQTDLPEHTS